MWLMGNTLVSETRAGSWVGVGTEMRTVRKKGLIALPYLIWCLEKRDTKVNK